MTEPEEDYEEILSNLYQIQQGIRSSIEFNEEQVRINKKIVKMWKWLSILWIFLLLLITAMNFI